MIFYLSCSNSHPLRALSKGRRFPRCSCAPTAPPHRNHPRLGEITHYDPGRLGYPGGTEKHPQKNKAVFMCFYVFLCVFM